MVLSNCRFRYFSANNNYAHKESDVAMLSKQCEILSTTAMNIAIESIAIFMAVVPLTCVP